MNGHQARRLLEIERAIAGIAHIANADERPAHMVTDSGFVEAWHQLAERPVAPPKPVSDHERDQITKLWRELNGR